MTPTTGRTVHYVSHGTPIRPDGSQAFTSQCRADSVEQGMALARDGWSAEVDRTVEVADHAVSKVERDVQLATFHPVWDVSGAEVDVARYLSGEPENMIDYEIVPTTRAGRVITVCASITFSSAVSSDAIQRRGHAVVALVTALSRLGYQVEVWTDFRTIGRPGRSGTWKKSPTKYDLTFRTLVKGANDEFDPAKIMFGLAHPAMLRAFALGYQCALPNDWPRKTEVGVGHGSVQPPIEDMPEGTIYLPELCSDKDVPDADRFLIEHLTELGVVVD